MTGDKFLVVPMQPTPNGRMHIGHGGGTYLRADVIARALRLRGADVAVVCGIDAYENWVLAEASRVGLDPAATCSLYYKLIRQDLESIGIHFDAWIHPLEEDRNAYLDLHERVFESLRDRGSAVLETERVPFGVGSDKATVGVWLAGRCPRCRAAAQGSSCVVCGSHFQPEELIDARSRLDDAPIEWRRHRNWFVRPDNAGSILESIRAASLSKEVKDAAEQYLVGSAGRIRLTGPGEWGMRSPEVEDGNVLSNPYFLYSMYCGEVDARLRGGPNPFSPGSGVTTIGVFGSDNTVPGVVAPHVFAQALPEKVRPFDRVVVNGMLNFEGQKCSTSKRHGIWLTELVENTSVTSDELRWVLGQQPLDAGAADLSLETLVTEVNLLRRWTRNLLRRLPELAGESVVWTAAVDEACRSGHDAWGRGVAELAADVRLLLARSHSSSASELMLLSVVAAPLLPDLSCQLWRLLGGSQTPNLSSARHDSHQVRPWIDSPSERGDVASLTLAEITPFVHREASMREDSGTKKRRSSGRGAATAAGADVHL